MYSQQSTDQVMAKGRRKKIRLKKNFFISLFIHQWSYFHTQSTGSSFMVVFSLASKASGRVCPLPLQHKVNSSCWSARPTVFNSMTFIPAHFCSARDLPLQENADCFLWKGAGQWGTLGPNTSVAVLSHYEREVRGMERRCLKSSKVKTQVEERSYRKARRWTKDNLEGGKGTGVSSSNQC